MINLLWISLCTYKVSQKHYFLLESLNTKRAGAMLWALFLRVYDINCTISPVKI